jgi:hypothetical protein
MKVFAVYDEAGRIIGVVTPRERVEDGAFELIAEPGQHVSEIELHETGGRQSHEVLGDLARNYRVERLATGARFVEKRGTVPKPAQR